MSLPTIFGWQKHGFRSLALRGTVRKILWFSCASLICAVTSPAGRADTNSTNHQAASYHHTGWNGLGAVFDLKQSPEGYLWLTTSEGVLRFDGVRFESVEEITRGAVQNNEVDSVFLSSSGGLWFTTQGAGLLFWKDGRLTQFPDRRCTPIRKQGRIIEDHDGSLWIQATAGLFHLRGAVCEQVGVEQGYPGGFPAGILLDSEGTLWVKTRTSGLLFLPRGQSKFQASKAGEGVSTGFAFLHEAPDGGIWLSDDQGLRRVATKLSSKTSSPTTQSYRGKSQFGDFTFAPDGTLWAASGKGVQRFDRAGDWPSPVAKETAAGDTFTPDQGLSSDAVWKILVDREGIWIGTNSGLDWLRRAALTTVRLPHAQEHEYSVAAGDNGSVWTGNSNLPLTHVTADGSISSFPRTGQTVALWRDHNGTIWSAGSGDFDLWRSSGKGFSPLHYPNEKLDSVVSIATDRNNDSWVTTSSGQTYKLSGGRWIDETETLGKKPGVIGAMADGPAGNVWFAFSNKVIRWDGSSYRRYEFPAGQRGVNENTIAVRGDHVWLGGAGGVQLFLDGQFYMLHWKDRDLPGRVSGIVETKTGDLWVNGFSGITHVPASELEAWLRDKNSAVSGERLNQLDGLPGFSGEAFPTPSLVEAPNGRLWFATTKGIAWLDPATFEGNRNRVPPPVIVSAIIANGKTYTGNTISLPANSENLEVEYTALSLAIPERVLFRYRLEGVDRDWQDVGTRRAAYYTRLRPGNYNFHVIASNNDGVWNENGAFLDFSIAPAYYQTIWFRLMCVAAGLGFLWLLYQIRHRQLQREFSATLEARVEERTRIARELHDTLLQSFQGLLLRFQSAANLLPARPLDAKEKLESAIDLTAQAVTEGRDAVQGLRKTKTNDLAMALNSLGQELVADHEGGNSNEFRVDVEGTPRQLHPVLRDEVYRIAAEALRNAFKHAKARQIELEIRYDSRLLRLRVRDDGQGIDRKVLAEGKREGHFGLSGMRERAKLIGGKLDVWSERASGTEVELIIPASKAYIASSVGRRSGTSERFSGKGTVIRS